MSFCEANPADERQAFLMLVFTFSRETHQHIRCDRDAGYSILDLSDLSFIAISRDRPRHSAQCIRGS